MADPADQLISRERSRTAGFTYQGGAMFFNLGLILFIVALVILGGLFFYRRTIDARRDEWVGDVAKRKEALGAEGGIGRLIGTSNSFNVARELTAKHVFSSNIFAFLAEVTHARVQFNSFSYARDSRKVDLSGLAASYKTVAEQVSILESHPQVEKVEFGGLASAERGLIGFRLGIIFKPSLLNLQVSGAGGGAAGQ